MSSNVKLDNLKESPKPEIAATGRHPLYLTADKLKEAFLKLGFRLADNGECMEVEEAHVTFATWEEPADFFGWQSNPIYLRNRDLIMRTRSLPARLRALEQNPPIRILTYGRVYQNDLEFPTRHQIEGFVVEEGLTIDAWKKLWNSYANALFGKDATASLESFGTESYKLTVKNPADGKVLELGYTGPASAQALKSCGVKDTYPGWVFVIDIEQFTMQYFSLTDKAPFYENDITFLKQFKSDAPSVGDGPEFVFIDTFRKMGYLEYCGDIFYPDDVYKKVNMHQAAWDTNNQPLRLCEPLGSLTNVRTVHGPALYKALALNYERGATDARIFDVSHVYTPVEVGKAPVKGQILPAERFTISFAAYGPDVTLESFTKDVEAVLRAIGIESYKFVPSDRAPAYDPNECLLLFNDKSYMDGRLGRIHKIGVESYGLSDPTYMAQLGLNTLVAEARGQK